MSELLKHILKLEFEEVVYEYKSELYSQMGHCNQSSEEFVKSNNKVKHVYGWLEKTLPNLKLFLNFYILNRFLTSLKCKYGYTILQTVGAALLSEEKKNGNKLIGKAGIMTQLFTQKMIVAKLDRLYYRNFN